MVLFMDQEWQQSCDTRDKINFDILVLTEKIRDVQKRIRETPWHHLRTQWRLYKDTRSLSKQTDEIGKRIKRLEENPIQIVKRT